MKRILIKSLPILLLIALCIWAGKGLFQYSIFSTHDGNHHIARSFDAVKTFSEGHFPLRWAGTLNWGCGIPIFNFFYPLIYYVVVIVNHFEPNIIEDLKIIDFGTFFVGTIFFYLWIRKETKDKWLATASAILYLYAPYRFLLVFVRGSPEFMAYAILPIVLYLYSLVFEEKNFKKFVLFSFLAAIAGGLLTISHNFTVMFLMPIVLIFLFLKIVSHRGLSIKKILIIAVSYFSAFGFGASFIFPAILEEKFTKLATPSFDYADHFPSLMQLLKAKWDYFYSAIGTELDGMSFQLGYAHWVVLGAVGIWLLYIFARSVMKKDLKPKYIFKYLLVLFFFVLSAGSIYLMLEVSTPVWEFVPILQKIQFPWRILGISVFCISALFPFWMMRIKNRLVYWLFIFAIPVIAFVGNRNHLLPQPIISKDVPLYENFEKLHGHRYSTTTFGDDIVAPTAEGSCWLETPLISTENEETKYTVIERGSTFGSVKFNAVNITGKRLVTGLGYYPEAYEFKINGQAVPYFDCGGRVCLAASNVLYGPNHISWQIVQTPTQIFFNKVTLAFLVVWLISLVWVLTGWRPTKRGLVFIAIFALFAFFRFYNLNHRVGFGWDQERDANAVSEILQGNFRLIGPRVLGDLGFFLPPHFFYLLVPFYVLASGSSFATVLFLIVANIIFFVVSYMIIKKLFNTKVALIFLALWAVNAHLINADIIAWNPVLVPLLTVILLYLCHKWRPLLIGIFLGIGISFHFQILLLIPMFIPKILKERKSILKIFLGTAASFVPILLFDLKNNFLNLKLIAQLAGSSGSSDRLSFILVWENVIRRLFEFPVNGTISIFVYIGFLILFIKKRKEEVWHSFLWIWAAFPIFFFVYGSRPSEYYFNFAIVIMGITLAYLVSKLNKILLIVPVIVLIYFSYKSTQVLNDMSFGLYKKDQVVQFVSTITKNTDPIDISFDLGNEGDVGFRYLLQEHGVNYSTGNPLIQLKRPPGNRSKFTIEGVGIEFPEEWLKKNWVHIE